MPRWANGTLTFPPPHHRHFILPVCVRCQRVWSELVLLSLPFLDCVQFDFFFLEFFVYAVRPPSHVEPIATFPSVWLPGRHQIFSSFWVIFHLHP